jgi:transposase-like protein
MSIKNERPNKGKLGRASSYSDSFRVQVALEYLDGSYSYLQIGDKYKISKSVVRCFVSWYKKNHEQLMDKEPIGSEQVPLSDLERKDLEKRLAMAEMKIAVLEKVIAIADKEYSTDLKKKAATK